ncbi:acyltransferase [Pseudomonas sp. PDM04]|jgi:maltose O-acetyltransferase|uniref:acyltransferase n=1 Tax=Pseudomonas sp. PDM04 TaxID=2769296 RepID=UPI001783F0D1|nr:acyltransferase [Pseudomonas sp. PDM04]MBD9438718.1 acyltransferase [Pseudomonas sp. PDM04]
MSGLAIRIISKFLDFVRSASWKITYSAYRDKYDLHKNFSFNGAYIQFYGEGKIQAGDGSYVGGLSTVQAVSECSVTIGAGCRISHNVRMYTQSADADADFSCANPREKQGNIIIGDYCWIGANVFISPGVTIGRNAVVGANSVVTRNIPPDEIWGGVPAKLIRQKNIASDAVL